MDKVIARVVRMLLLLAMGVTFYQKEWLSCFSAFLGLLLTFLPDILQRMQGICFPKWIQILYVLFIYGSIGLRRIKSFL